MGPKSTQKSIISLNGFQGLWSLKFPTKYKYSVITAELNRAKRIGTEFNCDVKYVTQKFLSAGFPRSLKIFLGNNRIFQ